MPLTHDFTSHLVSHFDPRNCHEQRDEASRFTWVKVKSVKAEKIARVVREFLDDPADIYLRCASDAYGYALRPLWEPVNIAQFRLTRAVDDGEVERLCEVLLEDEWQLMRSSKYVDLPRGFEDWWWQGARQFMEKQSMRELLVCGWNPRRLVYCSHGAQ